jgi:hypothetical protein
MARPSKLTEKQWDEVIRRHLAGESISKLAAEFGIARSAMSEKVSDRASKIKTAANQMLAGERALRELPVSDRVHAVSVKDRLSVLEDIYLQTAETAARNSMHMHNLAAEQKQYMDDADPLGHPASKAAVKAFTSLSAAGNLAMVIPSTLLKASQEVRAAEAANNAPERRVIVIDGPDGC